MRNRHLKERNIYDCQLKKVNKDIKLHQKVVKTRENLIKTVFKSFSKIKEVIMVSSTKITL